MTESQQTLDSRALRAVAVQFLINGTVAASFIPRLPEIRDALDVDLATIGQILTLASLGGLLGSWLAGWVMPKYGTKNAMIYGTLAVIFALPLVGFAGSPWTR
jgi:predicted MFS family arabinose efflux permease